MVLKQWEELRQEDADEFRPEEDTRSALPTREHGLALGCAAHAHECPLRTTALLR